MPWLKSIACQQNCSKNRSDDLAESVPEDVKNMLLVMHKEGVLHKDWKDQNGKSLWDVTWREAQRISYALTQDILVN